MKILFILLPITSFLSPATIEVTYFLKSAHFEDDRNYGKRYNENHKFIGVEYRYKESGLSLSTFINSFGGRSHMADYARYWSVFDNIEASARLGLASGYDGAYQCLSRESEKLCPTMSFGIAYTKYKYVNPKISIIPNALALSFSAKF